MAAFLPLILMFGLMWLLLIRPQQQRVRAAQALQQSLAIGDDVVTAGGVFGTIRGIDDTEVSLEVAPGVVVRVMRAAVNRRAGPEPSAYDDDDEDGDEDEVLAHGDDEAGE